MGRPKLSVAEKSIPEPNSGCWLWLSAIHHTGYGMSSYSKFAHRASYEEYFGEIPKGMHVCHKCDTRSCVNPGHLYAGTPRQNAHDRVNRDRGAKGSRVGTSVLTEAIILHIFRSKELAPSIARRLGVTPGTIYHIRTGRSWSHITGLKHPDSNKPRARPKGKKRA